MTIPGDTERVIVWAAGSRDAQITCELLARDGVDGITCADVSAVCDAITAGAAALLMTEDVLTAAAFGRLRERLDQQPPWSDFPILVFADDRDGLRARTDPIRALGNVSLLERPVRVRSMLASVHSAIRSRRRQYQARRAISTRDEFLAMLGHELRNPLGAIRFAVELAARHDGTASPKQFEIIDRQSHHLMRLVDDLLDVARVTHGKVTLQRERVDLVEIIRGLVVATEPLARSRCIVMTLHVAARSIPVSGDRLRLEQIFSNLLTNAVKYTQASGSVVVEVGAEGAEAVVRVRDTGIGIAPDMLPRIFDVFEQAERTLDRSQGGLGLGLAVVKNLVQLHGGTVEARSEGVGHGTELCVRLARLREVEVDREGAARASSIPPRSRSRRRIVAVEDNDDMRELLAELLELGGHEITLATDGPEGLQRILETNPDFAFVDVGLPGFDGFEVARRARAAGCAAHLVAMTGYGRREDRERAMEAGFDAHLTKPVDLAQIDEVLRRSRRAAARATG